MWLFPGQFKYAVPVTILAGRGDNIANPLVAGAVDREPGTSPMPTVTIEAWALEAWTRELRPPCVDTAGTHPPK